MRKEEQSSAYFGDRRGHQAPLAGHQRPDRQQPAHDVCYHPNPEQRLHPPSTAWRCRHKALKSTSNDFHCQDQTHKPKVMANYLMVLECL